jgi:hypothetical protein
MANDLTPYDDRECPIYGKVIDGELCYETAMCMQGIFKLSSVLEAKNIVMDSETARRVCNGCEYADVD